MLKELVINRKGNTLGVATEKSISIWDLEKKQQCISFEAIWDYGGDRLAVSLDGEFCCVASYSLNMVTVHDCLNGKVIWKNEELKNIQQIIYLKGARLAVVHESGVDILDSNTGERYKTIAKAESAFSDEKEDLLIVKKDDTAEFFRNLEKKIATIQLKGFAILSVDIQENMVIISEAGGTVRCFLDSGIEKWEYSPPEGSHVLNVAFCTNKEFLIGIEWEYEKGGSRYLLYFEKNTGKVVKRVVLGVMVESVISKKTGLIIGVDGSVFDVNTESYVNKLNI